MVFFFLKIKKRIFFLHREIFHPFKLALKLFEIEKVRTRIRELGGINWFEWKVRIEGRRTFSRKDCFPIYHFFQISADRWEITRDESREGSENQFLPIFVRKIPPRFRSRLIASDRCGARDAKGYCQRNRERTDMYSPVEGHDPTYVDFRFINKSEKRKGEEKKKR